MLFELNNVDYTDNVIIDTYKINSSPVFENYTDAKGTTHNVLIRNRVSGSFNLFFRKLADFNKFVADYKNGVNQITNAHRVYLAVNNTNVSQYYNCFLKFEATRNVDGTRHDFMDAITITVEER